MILKERTIGTKQFSSALLCTAVISLLISVFFLSFRKTLLTYWANFYQNWRDPYLLERVEHAPVFFLLLAIFSAVIFILIKFNFLNKNSFEKHFISKLKILFLIQLLIVVFVSIFEWQRFGSPCWDGYCYKADLWRSFLLSFNSQSFGIFYQSLLNSHVGTSVLPPILIGSISALGISIISAYMFLNLIVWIGIVIVASKIAFRYLDYKASTFIIFLVLFFAHMTIVRSFLFLQTDPIAVFFILLTVYYCFELKKGSNLRVQLKIILVMLLGSFTKLSYAPALMIPIVLRFVKNNFRMKFIDLKVFFAPIVSMIIFIVILYYTNLNLALSKEYQAVNLAISSDYIKDHNLLRFALLFLETFQFFLLLFFINRKTQISKPQQMLLASSLLFPFSLIFLKTAPFWLRYLMPSIPFLMLAAAPSLERLFENKRELFLSLILYFAFNITFILCRLYY